MIGLALLSLLTAFSGAVVPGPLFVLTLQQALVVGWMAGVLLMVGHMLAEVVVLGVLRAGLGGVLQRPAVTRVVGCVGGLVMLYFAWSTIDLGWHGPLATSLQGQHTALPAGALIVKGVLLSVLNPYWLLWWATIGVGLIGSQVAKLGPRAWVAFFIGHELADYIWYVGISLLVAFSRAFISESLYRDVILACGLGIAVIGVLFILRPLREWLRPALSEAALPEDAQAKSSLV